ncbi:MAG: thioredoxin fold domain-containing protein [Thiohalomonadaceae bacterium]
MSRFLVLFFLSTIPLTVHADAPEGYPFISFDKAMQQAVAEAKPVFIYFGRYGCGYCEKTNKEAFSDPLVRERFTENYILAYVDAESGKRLRLPSGERITERELGTRYKAFVTPVFSFLNSAGELQLRLVGAQSKVELLTADEGVQQMLELAK